MDKKLKGDICKVVCPTWPAAQCCQDWMNCKSHKEIEQAFLGAGWHPQSECLKQVTQDDITYIIEAWSKPEYKAAAGLLGQKVYKYIEGRIQAKLSPHEEVKP